MSDATKSSCLNATGRSLELKYIYTFGKIILRQAIFTCTTRFSFTTYMSQIFFDCVYIMNFQLKYDSNYTKMCRHAAIEKYLAKCFRRQYCVHHSWEQPNAVSIMPIVLMHSYIAGTRRYHVLCQTCVPNDKVMQANLYIQYLESCFLGKPSRTEICVNVKKPM